MSTANVFVAASFLGFFKERFADFAFFFAM
jgi:hypothetical protein